MIPTLLGVHVGLFCQWYEQLLSLFHESKPPLESTSHGPSLPRPGTVFSVQTAGGRGI